MGDVWNKTVQNGPFCLLCPSLILVPWPRTFVGSWASCFLLVVQCQSLWLVYQDRMSQVEGGWVTADWCLGVSLKVMVADSCGEEKCT